LQDELAPARREWLERHLAGCDACRGQFLLEQRLQRAMRKADAASGAATTIDAEAGLRQLLARIDRPDPPALAAPRRPRSWMGPALAAAVLVEAVGLGVMGARLWSLEPVNAEYRTLSAKQAPLPAGAIRLVPDPGLALADWNALLRDNRVGVVAGPNSVGAYTVVPLADADPAALLERLRANADIRLAEPAAGTP
jgi:hypothetical protein